MQIAEHQGYTYDLGEAKVSLVLNFPGSRIKVSHLVLGHEHINGGPEPLFCEDHAHLNERHVVEQVEQVPLVLHRGLSV